MPDMFSASVKHFGMCAHDPEMTSYHLANILDLLNLHYLNYSMPWMQFHPVDK